MTENRPAIEVSRLEKRFGSFRAAEVHELLAAIPDLCSVEEIPPTLEDVFLWYAEKHP